MCDILAQAALMSLALNIRSCLKNGTPVSFLKKKQINKVLATIIKMLASTILLIREYLREINEHLAETFVE